MGIFDNFSLDQFAGGLAGGYRQGSAIGDRRSAAERQQLQAQNAQKLAQARLKMAQEGQGLAREKFDFDKDVIASERAAAGEEKKRELGKNLQQALTIQNAIDAQRETGGLNEAQIAQINAAGGGAEQAELLNSLVSTNQQDAASAPLQALEQQKLLAEIGATGALEAKRRDEIARGPAGAAKPADLAILEGLGLDPTLENFKKLKTAGNVAGNQAAPKVLGGDQRLVSASGEVLYEPPAKVGQDATTKQINDASKANTSFKTVDDSLTKLDALVAQHGAEIAPGKVRDEMERLQADVLLELKELKNLGVLNGPDLDILKTQLVSPTPEGMGLISEGLRAGISAMFGGDSLADRSRASIANLRESSRTRRDVVAQEAGITPVDNSQFNLQSSSGVKYRVVQ